MNRERVLAVRDAIKAAPAHKFNMRNYFMDIKTLGNLTRREWPININDCQTAACIAGWTNIVRGANGQWIGSFAESSWLGLQQDQADYLFHPPGFRHETQFKKKFTKSRALAVLQRLADTGEVRWDRFDTRGRPIT